MEFSGFKEKKSKISLLFFMILVLSTSIVFGLSLISMHINKIKRDDKHSYSAMLHYPYTDPVALFEGFDNETGVPEEIVPNLIHFVQFGRDTLDFTTFLCMLAALKIHRPAKLIVHTDSENGTIRGYYWDQLLLTATKMKAKNYSSEENFPKVMSIQRPRPTHVYGQRLSSVWHAADVARLDLLQQFGGISLDGDSLMLQPFSTFRHFEMVLGWPKNGFIGTQVIVAHPKARLLHLWLEGYRHYKPRLWYYNAGQYPTEQILLHHPYLVHRVPVLFGVHNLADGLYRNSKVRDDLLWWKKERFYSIHLLSRHRDYLPHEDVTTMTDETSISGDTTAFGEMARWILYHVEPTCFFPLKYENG